MNVDEVDHRLNEIGALNPRDAIAACRTELRTIKRRMDSLRTSVAICQQRERHEDVKPLRAQIRDLFTVQERFIAAAHHHERLRDKQELHEAWLLVVSARYGAIIAAECCAEAIRLCVTHGVTRAQDSDRADDDSKPTSAV